MVSNGEQITICLKALADSTRLAIVTRLNEGELSVHEVAEEFPMSRPAISKHLKILREAGLVAERAAGRERIYAMEAQPLEALVRWLTLFSNGPGTTGSAARRAISKHDGRPARSSPGDWRVW